MNKYEIKGIVGEGAYGIVYKAITKETGEPVAIKKFKESDDDEIVKKTTLREVKMLRNLKQENIVTLIECFKKSNRLYLVFEYLEKNLLEILEERSSGLQPDLVRRYCYQLLKAIEYCHRSNVIHRDIKPENLLINPQKHDLRICDFGFARVLNNKAGQGLTDYVATRWYRAPELLLSNHYGKEVDIWAIGCIMGEITDGDPLFPGDSEIDQLFCIQKVLGPLTPVQQEEFSKNPRFVGLKFPDISKPETLHRKYVGKMSKECISLMSGMLTLDPEERFTAMDCLAHNYFDPIREPEVDQMIANWKQAKHQQQMNQDNHGDSAMNQYSNVHQNERQGRRGESSKSRHARGPAGDREASGGPMHAWGGQNSNQSALHTKHGQKFNQNNSDKNTPGGIASSKMKLKHHYTNQNGSQQYAGNLQQPPNPANFKRQHSKGKNNTNSSQSGVYSDQGGKQGGVGSNFVPSSNLSQFLLKKGSNGSLQTFDNEYSYKINLDNLAYNAKGQQIQVSQATNKKTSTLTKKNHLFKEVIVEDEAEDMRGSQLGAISNDSLGTVQTGIMTSGNGIPTQNSTLAGKRQHAMDLISMHRDTHSPTPQRNTSKGAVGNQAGTIKMPIKKSITGGLNKLHRDSMGDTGAQQDGQMQGNMQQPMGSLLNFYEMPGQSQQPAAHSREREAAHQAAQNGQMNTYEAPANLLNRLSPKMPIDSQSFHGGAHLSNHGNSGVGHHQAFHNLNNKLKKKQTQGSLGRRRDQTGTQNNNNNTNINVNMNVNMNLHGDARNMKDVSEQLFSLGGAATGQSSQQMLNGRGGNPNLASFLYQNQNRDEGHGSGNQGGAHGQGDSHGQYGYSIPSEAIYSSANLHSFQQNQGNN